MNRILAMLALSACTANTSLAPVSPSYPRATLSFLVEGVPYPGIAAAQRKTSQKITVYTPKDSPYLFLTSCHRETLFERPGSTFDYTYVPQYWVENTSYCLIKLTLITAQGKTQVGFIDLSSEDDLPYRLQCNGGASAPNGYSICQSRSGLIQRISFDVRTAVESATGCNPPEPDIFSYNIPISPGLCLYVFRAADGRFARLTTYGYTEVLP